MAKATIAAGKGLTAEQVDTLERVRQLITDVQCVFGAISDAANTAEGESVVSVIRYAALQGLDRAEEAESVLEKLTPPKQEEARNG